MPIEERFLLQAADYQPAYLHLFHTGELGRRAEEAIASLENCRVCPRVCGANRLADFTGCCKTGRLAVVSNAFPHMGEEDCLSGSRGSGTIFFSQCSLRCVFCQNFDISHHTSGQESSPDDLAGMMLSLQEAGCHNINLVTPDHVVPQILEALVIAIEGGLRLPLVYNTSGYTSLKELAWLDGVIDIYMPDFKTSSPAYAKLYLEAKDYPLVAEAAIRVMHRQVGNLIMDENGIARRGVLVRHLVMPGNIAETEETVRVLAEISPDIYVNIMSQYRPAGKVGSAEKFEAINRPATREEIAAAYQAAREASLWRFD